MFSLEKISLCDLVSESIGGPQVRSQTRRDFTFVAMICDNAEVQELLPQVLLGGPACFLARDATALQALVGPNGLCLSGAPVVGVIASV